MNSRHAAALALVGWYLMTAPVADQGAIIYQDAPLSQWTKTLHFDAESDCRARRQEKIKDSEDEVELAPSSEADEDGKRDAKNALDAALASQCVADDDPRISGSSSPLEPGIVRKLVH